MQRRQFPWNPGYSIPLLRITFAKWLKCLHSQLDFLLISPQDSSFLIIHTAHVLLLADMILVVCFSPKGDAGTLGRPAYSVPIILDVYPQAWPALCDSLSAQSQKAQKWGAGSAATRNILSLGRTEMIFPQTLILKTFTWEHFAYMYSSGCLVSGVPTWTCDL